MSKAGLEKLILQLEFETELNVVHLELRASRVDRKIQMFFSCWPSITCLAYISLEMCLSEASDIHFPLFSSPF